MITVPEIYIPAEAFRATGGRPELAAQWRIRRGDAIECVVDPEVLAAGDRLLSVAFDMNIGIGTIVRAVAASKGSTVVALTAQTTGDQVAARVPCVATISGAVAIRISCDYAEGPGVSLISGVVVRRVRMGG